MITAVDAIACAGLGYFFYYCDKKENFNLSRQTGHKLYLHFLIRGACYYFPSWLLGSLLLDSDVPAYFPFAVIYSLSLILLLAHLVWRKATNPDENTLALQAFRQSGDDLDYICATAIPDDLPIQMTLKNGKSYIGYIGRTIEPNKENPYLSIIPMGSGFRDSEGSLQVTHWYNKVIDVIASAKQDPAPNLDKYLMAIPRSEIVTCHIFDFDIYRDIQSQLGERPSSPTIA